MIDVDFSNKQLRKIPLEADWIRHYVNVNATDEMIKELLEL